MSILAPAAGVSLFLLIGIVALGVLVFEILMFLDVLKNQRISDTEKILWAVGMLFIHPIVAIAYYFIAHSKRVN